MRQDLSGEQWDAVDEGRLCGPNKVTYLRRTTRMKRKDAASLVESGCPVVTYWPGGLPEKTRIVWHEGDDAKAAWSEAHSHVTSDTPTPPRRSAVATAGRWESADGDQILLLTWHH